jgi:hypothetical protein
MQQRVPLWLAGEGGQIKYDVNDLASLSYNIGAAYPLSLWLGAVPTPKPSLGRTH